MAGAPAKGKQGGWGSFLSGAVAGLESRLDNMLADEDKNSVRSKAQLQEKREDAAEKLGLTPQQLKAQDDARARSKNRVNAKLQERLAKAVANKTGAGERDGSRPPASEQSSQRGSTDSKREETVPEVSTLPDDEAKAAEATSMPVTVADGQDAKDGESNTDDKMEPPAEQQQTSTLSVLGIPETNSGRPSQDSANRPSMEASQQSIEPAAVAGAQITADDAESELAQLQRERDEEAKQRQLEMHEHMERIDALQSKLQYLARQAAETAKQAKAEASGGSLEKKLAEKDETIALLMEEGQTLSKTELRLQTSLKQIRSKRAEEERATADLRKRLEKAEKSQQEAVSARQKANARIKEQEEKLKIVTKIEKDVGELTREKEQSLELVRDLREKLAEALTRAEEAEKKAQTDKLEAEQKRTADLREELDNAKIERKLLEDRLRIEVRDAKAEANKVQELSKLQEVELKSEITNLETQLELLRSRTEEASSAGTGESQAKLLRQIETLQTQYALARENWQGIEGTLNTRVATLEKERDDIAKREADIRKKAREVNTKARRQEEELETASERTRTLEQDLQEQSVQLEKLQSRATQAETNLGDARADFERQKKVWDAELQQRIEEEKTKLRLEMSSTQLEDPYLRTESPLSHAQRKVSAKDLGLLNHPGARRSPSFRDQLNGAGQSRRSSIHPQNQGTFRTPDGYSPRQLSASSLHQLNGDHRQAPPVSMDTTLEETSSLAGMDGPATGTSSPRHRENSLGGHTPIADLMSVSTINAGPSVQLVERMSAAVRRLESEKASLKDELSRLSSQRDEAREEVVRLMREGDSWKEKEGRMNSLESQVKDLENKYEGALEVLGERQEKCDELIQDVADLKDMLRSMAEERASK